MTLYDMRCNGRYSASAPHPAPFELDAVDQCLDTSRLVELKFSEKARLVGGVSTVSFYTHKNTHTHTHTHTPSLSLAHRLTDTHSHIYTSTIILNPHLQP